MSADLTGNQRAEIVTVHIAESKILSFCLFDQLEKLYQLKYFYLQKFI